MKTISSAKALEIAGLSRSKFNEIVADGFYPSAPRTEKGKDRTFTRADVVTLVAFAHALNLGMTPRYAGPAASEVGWSARQIASCRKVHVGADAAGRYSIWPDGSPTGHGPRLVSIVFDIDAIRAHVDSKVDWAGA